MEIGIFAKIFPRPGFEDALDAVHAHGLHYVQFNLSCAGLPSLPDSLEPDLCQRIGTALSQRGQTMSAVSGTFNMIHPDPEQRRAGLRGLGVLAQSCAMLGTSVITLCTGTRDPNDMWRRHSDNDTPAAWQDLCESIGAALRVAEDYRVTLGVEPELSNVVDSARKARRLLDEMSSPYLKIVMDGSNLISADNLGRMAEVLDEAFDLLSSDIALAHAKDLTPDDPAGHGAAGTGVLDYDRYLRLLSQTGYHGPLILHTLREDQVDASVAFLRTKLATL